MKAFKKVLSLAAAASMFLFTGYLHAEEEFVFTRDCNVEYSKKNVEENQDYLNRVKEKAGIQDFSEMEKITGFIMDTNPPVGQAKYFVLLPILNFNVVSDNYLCLNVRPFPRHLLYSSVLAVLINQREDSLKDVYFFMSDISAIPKDKRKNPAIIDIRKMDKNYREICQKYNKVCFQMVGGILLLKPADSKYDIAQFNILNGTGRVPMTFDEYKSWSYALFVTQTHNPYSKEFSMEKMFSLPVQPKEQVNLKNTVKLAEEAFQGMDTQTTNLQRMSAQGGKQ